MAHTCNSAEVLQKYRSDTTESEKKLQQLTPSIFKIIW